MSDMFNDELIDYHSTGMSGRDFFHRMVLMKQKQLTGNAVNYQKIYNLFFEIIATQTPFELTELETRALASKLISVVVAETRK